MSDDIADMLKRMMSDPHYGGAGAGKTFLGVHRHVPGMTQAEYEFAAITMLNTVLMQYVTGRRLGESLREHIEAFCRPTPDKIATLSDDPPGSRAIFLGTVEILDRFFKSKDDKWLNEFYDSYQHEIQERDRSIDENGFTWKKPN